MLFPVLKGDIIEDAHVLPSPELGIVGSVTFDGEVLPLKALSIGVIGDKDVSSD